jgi:hypothetical protein
MTCANDGGTPVLAPATLGLGTPWIGYHDQNRVSCTDKYPHKQVGSRGHFSTTSTFNDRRHMQNEGYTELACDMHCNQLQLVMQFTLTPFRGSDT